MKRLQWSLADRCRVARTIILPLACCALLSACGGSAIHASPTPTATKVALPTPIPKPSTFQGFNGSYHSVALSPDQRSVAAGDDAGVIDLWNAATGTHVRTLLDTGAVLTVAFSADGENLVAAAADGSINTWSVADGELIHG
jgi:WD40 repeat protein